jgi:hypothetical protein
LTQARIPPQKVVNDIDRSVEDVGRQLLEVHDHRIRGEWKRQPFPDVAHARQTEHGVLEVVVVQIRDPAAEPDGLFG